MNSVSVSPDGKMIASGGEDKMIRIWSTLARNELTCLEGHTRAVRSVCFSSDGNLIASGSCDFTVRVWNVRKKEQEMCLKGHTNNVNEVDFSPDMQLVASASDDNTVRLWSVSGQSEEALLEGHQSNVQAVNFSKDGRLLASSASDAIIIIWNVVEKQEEICLYGHERWVNAVVFSCDGRFLASGGEDKTMRIWNLTEKQEDMCFQEHYQNVFTVCISSDNRLIASGSDDKTVRIWNVVDNKEEMCLNGHSARVCSVAFSPDQMTLASGSSDTTIKIWGVAEKKEISCLSGHVYGVWSVDFSPDGNTLVSGSDDKTVKLWKLDEKVEIACLEGHTGSVKSVKFDGTGDKVISGSEDKTIRIWDIASKSLINKFDSASGVFSVDFRFDGHFVASGSDDHMVRVWNTAESREEICFKGHTNRVWSVRFSKNGNLLVSGSSDMAIKIWNLLEKREEMSLLGHISLVSSVMFSNDSKIVVSGSWDKTVRIWRIDECPPLFAILPVPAGTADMEKIHPDPEKDLQSLNESLGDPHFQSIKFFANALSMINQNLYAKISNWNIFIGPQKYTPLHFAAISGETETITQALQKSKHFKIFTDKYGHSPLYYSIAKKTQATTDAILQCITTIGQNQDINQKIECIHAVRNELPLIIRNSSQNLLGFLSVILQSRTLRPEFAAVDSDRIKLVNSINTSFSDFSVHKDETVNEPLRIKVTMLELPVGISNPVSFHLLKALLITSEQDIYMNQMVTSYIKYKWDRLRAYIYAYTFALWINLVLIIITFSSDYSTFVVSNILLIIVNLGLLLWQILQFKAEKLRYLKYYWNLIEISRVLLTFAWIGYKLAREQSEVFDWITILFNVVRGITSFRAFSMTRFYIQLITQSIIKISSFLLIFFYTTLAFGLLNNVGMQYTDLSFASLWVDSFGLVFGNPGNMASDIVNLIYATYFMAAMLNVIIMLNMIIALLGDSFDQFQTLAKYYDNREMIKVILEIEEVLSVFHQSTEQRFMHICENFYNESEDLWQGKVVDMRMLIKNTAEESSRVAEGLKKKIDELGTQLRNQMSGGNMARKDRVRTEGGSTGEELSDMEGRINECLVKSEKRVAEGVMEIERKASDNIAKREKYMYDAIRQVGQEISDKIIKGIENKDGSHRENEAGVEMQKDKSKDESSGVSDRLKTFEEGMNLKMSEISQRISNIETDINAKLDRILQMIIK